MIKHIADPYTCPQGTTGSTRLPLRTRRTVREVAAPVAGALQYGGFHVYRQGLQFSQRHRAAARGTYHLETPVVGIGDDGFIRHGQVVAHKKSRLRSDRRDAER